MKTIENLLLKACGYTLSILFLFYLFGVISDFTNPYIDFKTFLTIFLFGALISVSELIFKIKKLHYVLKVLIHFVTLFTAFTVVFVFTGNISSKGPASIFSALIIFTFLYAVLFTAAYFIRKFVKKADSKIEANRKSRAPENKEKKYQKLYKNED